MQEAPQIVIRPYEPKDAREVAALCGELGYPATENQITERLEQLGPRWSLLVAVHGPFAAVVGWIELLTVTHIASGTCLEIGGLVVTEAARSRGVGSMLVEAAEEMGRRMGLPRVRVRSNVVRKRAHSFYERLGYQDVKTSKVFEKPL